MQTHTLLVSVAWDGSDAYKCIRFVGGREYNHLQHLFSHMHNSLLQTVFEISTFEVPFR